MYKYLLTGCAAAALSLSAGVAAAQDFKVTLSGNVLFQAAIASQDRRANTRSVDFRDRFRLWINPEAVGLDGALTYGAKVQLLYAGVSSANIDTNVGNTIASFDHAFTYLKGAFGTVQLGVQDTYSDDFNGTASGLIQRPTSYQAKDDAAFSFVGGSRDARYAGADAGRLASWRDSSLLVGDANSLSGGVYPTAVRYATPFVFGFQAAVQYAPSSAESGWNFLRGTNAVANGSTTNFQDAYEVGLLFNSKDKTIADKFGDAYLLAAFDYQHAKNGYAGKSDFDAYQLGLNVGYQTFVLGGAYQTYGKSGLFNVDQNKVSRYSWNFGAQYTYGAFVFGTGYQYAQRDVDYIEGTAAATSNVGKKTSQGIFTGVKYTVAKGLDVYGEYDYVQNKNTMNRNKDSANVVVLSTKVTF